MRVKTLPISPSSHPSTIKDQVQILPLLYSTVRSKISHSKPVLHKNGNMFHTQPLLLPLSFFSDKPKLIFIVGRICWILFLIAWYSGGKKKSHLHQSEDIFHFSAQAVMWKPVVYKTMVWGKLGCLKRNALLELLGNFWFLPISSLCPSCSLLANYHLCRQSTWLDLLGN